jgi:single-strand DNA-binding protein
MSEGLNRVILIGNLGQAPELRHTQNSAVLNLRLATTESFLNQEKQRQERTEWHTVVIWGKRGEALGKILNKGDRICIEGRIQTRSWEAQDGSKRYATDVVATNVILLGGRRENRQEGDYGDHGPESGPPPVDSGMPPHDEFPF